MAVLVDHAQYRVELTDSGIFAVSAKGAFDEVTVADFERQTEGHVLRLAPLRYLNDATLLHDASLSAFWSLAKLVKRRLHLVKRSAVCGVSPNKRLLVNGVLRAAGRKSAQVFERRDDAERFLLE
ncbi:MAG TPA: hypothetical protein VGO62_11780 [Myxococcota bacterium]